MHHPSILSLTALAAALFSASALGQGTFALAAYGEPGCVGNVKGIKDMRLAVNDGECVSWNLNNPSSVTIYGVNGFPDGRKKAKCDLYANPGCWGRERSATTWDKKYGATCDDVTHVQSVRCHWE